MVKAVCPADRHHECYHKTNLVRWLRIIEVPSNHELKVVWITTSTADTVHASVYMRPSQHRYLESSRASNLTNERAIRSRAI